jgi:hypothetical protein
MKPCRLVIAAITLIVAARAQSPEQRPPLTNPKGDDIEALVRDFMADGAGVKGEFETTAQFEARMKKGIQADRRYAFICEESSYWSFSYDADKAAMTASVRTIGFGDYASSKSSRATEKELIPIKETVRSTSTRVGQNALGVSATILSSVSDEFALVISQEAAVCLYSHSPKDDPTNLTPVDPYTATMTFPLTIERAQRIKPSLRIVFVGTMPNAQVFREEGYHTPTVNDPNERTVHRYYINFDPVEVRFVNTATGETVAYAKR